MKRSLRTTAIGIALLAGVAASHAQGTFIKNGKNYIVHRDNIPDFDQRKMFDAPSGAFGLPNNGNMYCVPTSILNNLSYLANHGYPLLAPGLGTWSGSAPTFLNEYNHVTNVQYFQGTLYQTDPSKGTGGTKDSLQAYLDSVYPGQFAVSEIYDGVAYAPSIYDAAQAMLNGSLVNLAYGWYKKDYYYDWATFSSKDFYYRNGGHMVTMVGAQDWNGTVNVSLHDPANIGNDTDFITQSFFKDDVTTYQNFTSMFSWKDTFMEDEDKFSRTMQVLDYSGGYLDCIQKIGPKNGYTYEDDGIIFITPSSPTNDRGRRERPLVTKIATGLGHKITDLAMDPFTEIATFVIEDSGSLFNFDPVSQKVTRGLKVANPRQVLYDDAGRLVVLRSNYLDIYDRLLNRELSVRLPKPLDAIAIDPSTKRLVGYSRSEGILAMYDQFLNREGTVSIPVSAAPPEKAKLFFDDAGNAYLLGKGSRSITKVSFERTGAKTTQLPIQKTLADPDGGYVDETGKIFLTINGEIVPLLPGGFIDRRSKFYGMPAGESLHIKRPFASKKPDPLIDPAYVNVLPPFERR